MKEEVDLGLFFSPIISPEYFFFQLKWQRSRFSGFIQYWAAASQQRKQLAAILTINMFEYVNAERLWARNQTLEPFVVEVEALWRPGVFERKRERAKKGLFFLNVVTELQIVCLSGKSFHKVKN